MKPILECEDNSSLMYEIQVLSSIVTYTRIKEKSVDVC